MRTIKRSLTDMLGRDYTRAVCEASAFLAGVPAGSLQAVADEVVDFYPGDFQARQNQLLEFVGKKVCSGLASSLRGAPTDAFGRAQSHAMSPVGGAGVIRIGEDGRAYFIGKSEHYHASLGHAFPGYRLLEHAVRIGISNVTHNNTRGYPTRLAERELVRMANGLERADVAGLEQVLGSSEPHVLNRVINLETGSLAVEAALKMMLARFYPLDATFPPPVHAGKTPVFLVMADNKGGCQANYHGTTILAQVLRGMWPEFGRRLSAKDLFRVESVRINDLAHFQSVVERWDAGSFKVAGFMHELVLMNYGGIRLTRDYVAGAHALCAAHGIPVLIDEIQSCMWAPGHFLFREYGCRPDFVAVGKGFPGGQYPASKILTTAEMDSLNQFGALVTNGQEDLAALAYLITMEFAEVNRDVIHLSGRYYHEKAIQLAARYPRLIAQVEGEAHMTSFFFTSANRATRFAEIMNKQCCIDVGVQTYKADCPPAALTKLPLIASRQAIDFVIVRMDETLGMMQAEV